MKQEMKASQADLKYDINWTSLGEYLEYLQKKGVSTNITSFVGTNTLRIYTVGYEDREPTAAGLEIMKTILRKPGSPERVLVVGFDTDSLKYMRLKTASTREQCREGL